MHLPVLVVLFSSPSVLLMGLVAIVYCTCGTLQNLPALDKRYLLEFGILDFEGPYRGARFAEACHFRLLFLVGCVMCDV